MSHNSYITLPPTSEWLIFTDLDGTLLDHHSYSYAAALEALGKLKALGVPVIMNSSKTFTELQHFARELALDSPFIAENGSIIAYPEGYPLQAEPVGERQAGFSIEYQGRPYREIIEILHRLREENGFEFEGFADWDKVQLSEVTGLSEKAAESATQRLGSEPILWRDSAERLDELRSLLHPMDLQITKGGRFHHIMGDTDKVIAMQRLKKRFAIFRNKEPFTIALGDGPNDTAMLQAADLAIVVANPESDGVRLNHHNNVIHTEAEGPTGWNQTMLQLLQK